MASFTNSEKTMSTSDEYMSSISWTEIGKTWEDIGNSYIRTSESESDNINLCLSLGGLYEENVPKDMKGKEMYSECPDINLCLSLGGFYEENVSKDMKGKKKMYPDCPENWAVESAAMDKLKSNCFPLTFVPLTIRDPSPIISDEKEVEASLENQLKEAKANQNQNPDLMQMMPRVSTIGEGPYGSKIEGFLMSPTGFINHAGKIEHKNPMNKST